MGMLIVRRGCLMLVMKPPWKSGRRRSAPPETHSGGCEFEYSFSMNDPLLRNSAESLRHHLPSYMCSKIVPHISHMFKYHPDPNKPIIYSGLTTKLFQKK